MKLRDWLTLTPLFLTSLGRLPVRHLLYLARKFANENPHRHRGRLHVDTFFPPYPSKAFDRFVDSAANRRRIPYSAYFAVTDVCPYSCGHCSYGSHTRGRLDTAAALRVIAGLKSLGTITIGFTGGEPLLRDDIAELVAAAGDDTCTILFTTGHRLDADLAKSLLDAGLGCLTVGLESDDPNGHDQIRGQSGSFDEGIRAIETALNAGHYTAISTVATGEKVRNGTIERLALLGEKYGVHEFRVLEPVVTGRCLNGSEAFLTEAESAALRDFHKRWNRQNRGPAISAFSYLESDEMFGCGAGFHHLFIDALGNACPCDLTPLCFGNVLEEPIEQIWSRMGEFFPTARCGCLMKEIAGQIRQHAEGSELPLPLEKSLEICRGIEKPEKVPGIYQHLFRGQKAINPPSSRP